jgi:hypothetical protein
MQAGGPNAGIFSRNEEHPGSEILVVDVETRCLERTIDISPHRGPHGLAFDKRGLLWITCDVASVLVGVQTGVALSAPE